LAENRDSKFTIMTNILDLKNKNIFRDKAKPEREPAEKLTRTSESPWAVEETAEKTKSVAKKMELGDMQKPEVARKNDDSAKDNSPLLEWVAPEFIKYYKEPEWFMVGGLVVFGLLLFALFTKNFIFALIIILASFTIFIWTQKEPKKIAFSITPKGIMINKKNLLVFDDLKSFWVFNEPSETKYISIESKKVFMPRIAIPLGEQRPEEIRQVLSKFLPEKEQEKSLIDAMGKHFRY